MLTPAMAIKIAEEFESFATLLTPEPITRDSVGLFVPGQGFLADEALSAEVALVLPVVDLLLVRAESRDPLCFVVTLVTRKHLWISLLAFDHVVFD